MSIIVSGVWSTSSRLTVNWSVVCSRACESLFKTFPLCRFGTPPPIWFVLHLFPVARKLQFLSWYLKLCSLSYVAWHLEHFQTPPCCLRTWRSKCGRCVKVHPHCEQICSIGGLNTSRMVAILDLDVLPCSFHYDRVTRMRNAVRGLLLYPSKGPCLHSNVRSDWKHESTATCCIVWYFWRGCQQRAFSLIVFDFTLRMDHVYIAMFVLIESMKVLQRVASCDIFGGAAYNVYFHWSCLTLWTQLFARTCLMNTESIETHILTHALFVKELH